MIINEELCMRIKRGDKSTENELVGAYLQLVKTIAGKHQGVCENDDLIQVGCMALLRAAKTYCTDKGSSFETYASNCIRNAMTDLIRREMRHLNRRADYSLDEFVPGSDERYIDQLPEPDSVSDYEDSYSPEEYENYELIYNTRRVEAYMHYRFGPKGDKRIPRKEAAAHFHITLDEAKNLEREGFGWLLYNTCTPSRIKGKERELVEFFLSQREKRNDPEKYSHHNIHYWYWEDDWADNGAS